MNEFPCKDCIILPMCKTRVYQIPAYLLFSRRLYNDTVEAIVSYMSCSIILDYCFIDYIVQFDGKREPIYNTYYIKQIIAFLKEELQIENTM